MGLVLQGEEPGYEARIFCDHICDYIWLDTRHSYKYKFILCKYTNKHLTMWPSANQVFRIRHVTICSLVPGLPPFVILQLALTMALTIIRGRHFCVALWMQMLASKPCFLFQISFRSFAEKIGIFSKTARQTSRMESLGSKCWAFYIKCNLQNGEGLGTRCVFTSSAKCVLCNCSEVGSIHSSLMPKLGRGLGMRLYSYVLWCNT